MMKTEALLLIALMAGVLSAWTLILGLDFIIDEEKKKLEIKEQKKLEETK